MWPWTRSRAWRNVEAVPVPPTYVIDLPEARRVMRFLSESRGVETAGVFAPIGRVLPANQTIPRALPLEPFIVMNGSGNYHHETVTIVEQLLAMREGELVYIQIDAHPDSGLPFRWHITCGTFLGRILENPRVAEVYLLGQNPPCIKDKDYPMPCIDRLDYYRCDYFGKFHQYLVGPSDLGEAYFPLKKGYLSAAKKNKAVRRAKEAELPPRKGVQGPGFVVDWRTVEEFRPDDLPELPVYLTIDLDVSRSRPITDWRRPTEDAAIVADNQGEMEWGVLLALVEKIGANRQIAGADVCGFLERFDLLSAAQLEDSLGALGEIYDAMARAMRSSSSSPSRGPSSPRA
jgi:hypothetical protein